ncbi:hypothetical protein AB0E75_33675 [Streptomyces griseoviridis]|uniref:Uncharacterized protein n=1 Tax=Streptomyces griseoviridis TaxID=45398 RepID=A0A918GSL7_STRGD|nr:hypothetical protein [Streptomyces niveoruber]GGS55730.1 hypothetical protein GCM10010238_51440 [Streptomyces niveoruber]
MYVDAPNQVIEAGGGVRYADRRSGVAGLPPPPLLLLQDEDEDEDDGRRTTDDGR